MKNIKYFYEYCVWLIVLHFLLCQDHAMDLDPGQWLVPVGLPQASSLEGPLWIPARTTLAAPGPHGAEEP